MTDYRTLFTEHPEEAVAAIEALSELTVLGEWRPRSTYFERSNLGGDIPHKAVVFQSPNIRWIWRYSLKQPGEHGVVVASNDTGDFYDTPELAMQAADTTLAAMPNVIITKGVPDRV